MSPQASPTRVPRTVHAGEFIRLWRSGGWTSGGIHAVAGFTQPAVYDAVARIIAQVRLEGQAALVRLTRELDGPDLDRLEVPVEDLERWAAETPGAVREALEFAHARIREFARRCLSALGPLLSGLRSEVRARSGLWEAWSPLGSVGLYVPGGRAQYPSSVLMTAAPARVAGVREVVLCTPPRPDGSLDPAVAAAAVIARVDRVFRLGGAQAVAAMALGAGEVPRVEKVAGPGNAYVTEAKRQLFGLVGLDGLAGPSEFLAVTDCRSGGVTSGPCGPGDVPGTTSGGPGRAPDHGEYLAWQLLAQAEHDPGAFSAAVLLPPASADAVARAISAALDLLPGPRREAAILSLGGRGALIEAAGLDEAAAVVEAVRPEHLWVDLTAPGAASGYSEDFALRTAPFSGAVFIGPCSPVALGDYVAGPSHVLPTGGSAAWGSPLGVTDFMRRVNLVKLDAGDVGRLWRAGTTLAAYEGFTAHGRSIACSAGRAGRPGGVSDDGLG